MRLYCREAVSAFFSPQKNSLLALKLLCQQLLQITNREERQIYIFSRCFVINQHFSPFVPPVWLISLFPPLYVSDNGTGQDDVNDEVES